MSDKHASSIFGFRKEIISNEKLKALSVSNDGTSGNKCDVKLFEGTRLKRQRMLKRDTKLFEGTRLRKTKNAETLLKTV